MLSRIVVAAKSRGLAAIDGPYAAIRDLDGLREAATRSRLLGCDGKWALHPDQIAVVNEVFSPSEDELARAQAVDGCARRAPARTGAACSRSRAR